MPTLKELFGGQVGGMGLPESPTQPTVANPKIPAGAIEGSNRYGETEAEKKPLTDQLAGKSLAQVLKQTNPDADPTTFMQENLTLDERTGAYVAKINGESVYFKQQGSTPSPESLIVIPLSSLAPAAQGQKQQNVQQQMNEQTGMNPAAFGGA